MIVPRSKLLLWVAIVVLPFALLGAISSEMARLAVAAVGLFVAVAALDAILGLSGLEGIGVELPKIVRLSKDRQGTVEVQIRNEREKARQLRLGLALPAELESAQEDLLTILPAQARLSRLGWLCTGVRRGTYYVQQCHLETESPLGFWAIRGVTPAQSEIRVYPNLQAERKSVAALFLNRGNFGLHAQRQIGKGRDFEKLREYSPGDSFDEIHWKATAKRGRPVTKVFQIEKTQEVYVIIDTSRLSARNPFGTDIARSEEPAQARPTETSVLERFITSGLILGLAAEQQGDLFGVLTFSDRVQRFVRAKNGKAHYSACREAVYPLQPSIVTPDFDEVCSFIRLRLRRRALLVFLTALDDPVLAESFVRNIELISRQHLVLVNMMQPPGVKPLFSDDAVARIDDLYARLGGHLLWSDLRELEKTLQRRGAQFSLVENEKLSGQLITQYLSIKRRQLL